MKLENECRLSFYRELTEIDETHQVKLVQHTETGRIFVLKTLCVYDLRVYRYLLSHPIPGVPRIEELIEGDGTLYVIEEYISGTSIRDRLAAKGPFPEEEAVRCIRQLCSILLPLHQQNPPLVHRDIKPSNLILTSDDRLFLIDFNSAKESSSSETRDTVLFGTAGYAAPEQYGFSSSQPTADIYAIGVLLNEMLTGKMPDAAICSGHLEPVIRKCLRMDPDARYRDLHELLKALDRTSRPFTVTAEKSPGSPAFSYALPGFRSRKLRHLIPAAIWYLYFTAVSFSMPLASVGAVGLFLYRLTIFLVFLLETLWFGNYLNIREHFRLCRSRYSPVRILGAAIGGVLLFLVPFVLGSLAASFFP